MKKRTLVGMRKAISMVLAGLLLILPVEQVLAQAIHQEADSIQQAPPPDAAARLLRVAPLTENSAQLLRTSSDRVLLNTSSTDAPLLIGLQPRTP